MWLVPEDEGRICENLKGVILLDDLSELIGRYIVMTAAEADVCALWTVHTHALDAAAFTPYLDIMSVVPRCGKTTLLEIESLLVADPWLTGHVTAPALVRKTDQNHPTLLLDESDTTFHGGSDYSQALRGILNTGYERTGTYSTCVRSGGEWVSKDFSTFSAKAIAGIGKLPDTVRDRSIPIRLKRKLPAETCERFRKRLAAPDCERLRHRAARWAKRSLKQLAASEPAMPDELNDRQQDVCEPLLAIADLAGSNWPQRARNALITLLTSRKRSDDSQPVRLLSDIKSCFDQCATDRMRTKTLLRSLNSNEEWPWQSFNKGGRLTDRGLADALEPFEIRPRDVRFEEDVFKGYRREFFEDAWARYLPPPTPTKKTPE